MNSIKEYQESGKYKDLWNPNKIIGLYDIIPFSGGVNEVRRNIQRFKENGNIEFVVQDQYAYMPFTEVVTVIQEQIKYTKTLYELYIRVNSIMEEYVTNIKSTRNGEQE